MTDWSIYQLDDIDWDEFRESGDHIVPHPGGEHVDDCGGCHKKLLHGVVTSVGKSSDSKSVAKDVILERKEISFPALNDRRGPMPEKDSWSCKPGVVFSDYCDTESTKEKEMTGLGSDDAKISGNCFKSSNFHNEFCENDTILGSKAASIDGSMYQFSLGDISPPHSDIELFSNEQEDKDSNFLSYYGWPDIGNFEEVDRMFRSCDSTFGQGNAIANDDELSWFTSSMRDFDGSEDALETGFKSSYPELGTLKHQEPDLKFMPVSATPMVIDIDKKHAPDTYITCLQTIDDSDASLGYSYDNMLDANVESERVPVSKKQHMERSSNSKQKQMQGRSSTDTQRKDIAKAAIDGHFPVQKQLQKVQDGVGGHSDVGMRMQGPAVDSSGVLEGSSMSSMLSDEISLEATSFRQLQYVMEQLDIRTKLCIRDSLYRLARSAEQRNNFGNSNNYIWDGRDKGGVLTTEESNKRTGFVDMETDTNPIDRSIAHLLFHRPSDPAEGALFNMSRTMGSSQPVMPMKSVCQEEISGGEVDTNLSTTDQ